MESSKHGHRVPIHSDRAAQLPTTIAHYQAQRCLLDRLTALSRPPAATGAALTVPSIHSANHHSGTRTRTRGEGPKNRGRNDVPGESSQAQDDGISTPMRSQLTGNQAQTARDSGSDCSPSRSFSHALACFLAAMPFPPRSQRTVSTGVCQEPSKVPCAMWLSGAWIKLCSGHPSRIKLAPESSHIKVLPLNDCLRIAACS